MKKETCMKAIHSVAVALFVAAATLMPQQATAQSSNTGYSPDGVVLKKIVVEGDKPNTYTINLETFVTGESIVTEAGGPLDVVLVLDFSGSLQGEKWANLESAVSNFLKSLRDYETQYSAGVKVGIVSFNSGYATHTIGLVDPTSEDITKFISRLDNHEFEPQGSTRIDYGMRQANDWLYGYGRRDVMKSVVVFTDGQPESANTGQFENLNVAMDAINYAQTMKMSYGATIYSIGLISEGDEDELIRSGSDVFAGYQGQTTNISGEYLTTRSFLERISSLYPEASITSTFAGAMMYEKDRVNFGSGWLSPKNEEDTYYQRAETNTLSDIFDDISEKIIGGASYELEGTSTTVIDVVSPAFKLPDGANANKISLSVARCINVQSTGTGPDEFEYVFDTPIDLPNTLFPDVKAAVGNLVKTKVGDDIIVTFEPLEEGGKTVSVTGFDFSANFVGLRQTGAGPMYDGYKLIISFPIEIDPSNPGGATQNTNTEDSGVYVDQGNGYQQIGGFEIPTVKIPNIVVIKNGLKKGDSAIFKVYKVEDTEGHLSEYPIMLVATCKEDGQPAIAKTKIQKPGRYKIVETSWSWSYNLTQCQSTYTKEDNSSITTEQWHEKGFGAPEESGYPAQIPFTFGTVTTANSITRNVNDFTEEENTTLGYKGTLFIFTNEKKNDNPPHAEAYKNNEFYETQSGSSSN